jgi:hypothetical protein
MHDVFVLGAASGVLRIGLEMFYDQLNTVESDRK